MTTKRRQGARSFRFAFAAALLGSTWLGSLPVPAASAAIGGARAPFAAPRPLNLEEAWPTPFVDVTGSVTPIRPDIGPDAALAPAPSVPALGIAPPDPPAAPVLDMPTPAGASQAQALEAALRTFQNGPDPQPGVLTAEQTRQRQAVRRVIAAFYQARNNAPLWIHDSEFSAAAHAALARIDHAADDGLTLRGYALPVLRESSTADLIGSELALSEAVVGYALEASGSRVDPLQINRLITAKRSLADVPTVLTTVSTAGDADQALWSFNPPQPGYAALRAKLAELRRMAPMARPGIPLGPTLKLGMRDPRVPLIRSRFGLDTGTADLAADQLVYDTKVAGAVAEFQKVNGLPASGTLTPRTIAILSGGNPDRLENELIANMERWRWLPRDLGTDHLLVNVPDYSLELVQNGVVTHRARVVVGKPDHQTPIFSNAMRFIIVNPYWNVPLSIIKKEMLPKLAENPNYFADHGYEVVERDGVPVVRQPPGEDNALGRIKFMFPNEHSVYLHDTNARALFGKTKRAFSHGCVRVDQPFKLASVILGPDRWSEKRIQKLVGGDEHTISLPHPLPIHLAYFTAFVDERGALQLRDDLYGYSDRVKLALGLRD